MRHLPQGSSGQSFGCEMTKSDARNLQQRYGEIMSEEKNRLRRRGGVGIMKISGDFLGIRLLPNPCACYGVSFH